MTWQNDTRDIGWDDGRAALALQLRVAAVVVFICISSVVVVRILLWLWFTTTLQSWPPCLLSCFLSPFLAANKSPDISQIIQLTIFIAPTLSIFPKYRSRIRDFFLDNRPDMAANLCYLKMVQTVSNYHTACIGGWKLMSHFDTFFRRFHSRNSASFFSHLLMLFCLGGWVRREILGEAQTTYPSE